MDAARIPAVPVPSKRRRRWHGLCSWDARLREEVQVAVEVKVSEAFARWYEELRSREPDGAAVVEQAVVDYAAGTAVEGEARVEFDLCLAPPPRGLAFVAAVVPERGIILLAGGEVGESARRCTALLRKAQKIVTRLEQGREGTDGWAELRTGSGGPRSATGRLGAMK
jgi:hypothetical protein